MDKGGSAVLRGEDTPLQNKPGTAEAAAAGATEPEAAVAGGLSQALNMAAAEAATQPSPQLAGASAYAAGSPGLDDRREEYLNADVEFLQNRTRSWLEAMLNESLDTDANKGFLDLLKDGSLLYRLSKGLDRMRKDPNLSARDAFLEKDKDTRRGEFHSYDRTTTFINTCKEFGVDEVELASAVDLVEGKNDRSVCLSIRALAKRAQDLGLDVLDFDEVGRRQWKMPSFKVEQIANATFERTASGKIASIDTNCVTDQQRRSVDPRKLSSSPTSAPLRRSSGSGSHAPSMPYTQPLPPSSSPPSAPAPVPYRSGIPPALSPSSLNSSESGSFAPVANSPFRRNSSGSSDTASAPLLSSSTSGGTAGSLGLPPIASHPGPKIDAKSKDPASAPAPVPAPTPDPAPVPTPEPAPALAAAGAPPLDKKSDKPIVLPTLPVAARAEAPAPSPYMKTSGAYANMMDESPYSVTPTPPKRDKEPTGTPVLSSTRQGSPTAMRDGSPRPNGSSSPSAQRSQSPLYRGDHFAPPYTAGPPGGQRPEPPAAIAAGMILPTTAPDPRNETYVTPSASTYSGWTTGAAARPRKEEAPTRRDDPSKRRSRSRQKGWGPGKLGVVAAVAGAGLFLLFKLLPREEEYIVRRGDTLSKIAESQGISEADCLSWVPLYRQNSDHIDDPNLIYPNDRLRLPRGRCVR